MNLLKREWQRTPRWSLWIVFSILILACFSVLLSIHLTNKKLEVGELTVMLTIISMIGYGAIGMDELGIFRRAVKFFRIEIPANSAKNADSAWLRWLATIAALETALSICLYQYAAWLISPSVAALGVALCLYFGHLLLLRVQCSLLEFFAITTTFGLVDGLVVSTPGALQLGLYLTPMIAAWVLYSAVSGIVNASLSGANSARSRLLHIAAALWGNAAVPLMGLGVAILCGEQDPRLGMEFYGVYAWPFLIAGVIGFLLSLRIGVKARGQARAILQSTVPAPEANALNSLVVDAKP